MQTKTLALNKGLAITIAQFAGLLLVATITPAIIHYQPITGPIVNATLFLAAIWLGSQNAILIGLIPSTIALSAGLLPTPLAPMIPFIMLSNALLAIVFGLLYRKNFWLAAISASILKFLFLFSTSFLVSRLIVQEPIAQKAAAMMSWPQLATALLGALVAFSILKLKKN